MERGIAGLRDSVMHGRARMSKRGGCFSCTDAELDQALSYMVTAAQIPWSEDHSTETECMGSTSMSPTGAELCSD